MVAGGLQRQLRSFRRSVGACPTFSLHSLPCPARADLPISRGQTCVRRRAVLSVEANPHCKSRAEAEQAVDDVWNSCKADTRPFDRLYK